MTLYFIKREVTLDTDVTHITYKQVVHEEGVVLKKCMSNTLPRIGEKIILGHKETYIVKDIVYDIKDRQKSIDNSVVLIEVAKYDAKEFVDEHIGHWPVISDLELK